MCDIADNACLNRQPFRALSQAGKEDKMKRSVLFLAVALIASWALLGNVTFAGIGPIESTITFDDTGVTDTVNVSVVNLDPTNILNVQISSGIQNSGSPYVTGGPVVEYGRVTFFIADGVGFPRSADIKITEPSTDPYGGPVSDIFYLVGTSVGSDGSTGTAYDAFFESDYLGNSPQLLPNFLEVGPFSEVEGGLFLSAGLPTNSSGGFTGIRFLLNSDLNNSEVPEPSTFLLLGAGLAGVGILRRRFKK